MSALCGSPVPAKTFKDLRIITLSSLIKLSSTKARISSS